MDKYLEWTGPTEPLKDEPTERTMQKFIKRVKEEWEHNPLGVTDSVCYALIALAAVKYLRSK